MGDFADEVLAGVQNEFDKILHSNKSAEAGEADEDDKIFAKFDDSFINNVKYGHIESNHVCKKILFISICEGTGIRAWDVLLLLPALFFVAFLGIRWSSTKRKLLATHSMMFRTFHFLVATNVALALFRSLVSMILFGTTDPETAQVLDKILWISLQSFMLFTEVSVLVFGLCGGQFDSFKSIRKIIVGCFLTTIAFTLSESVFELRYPDTSFLVHYNTKVYGLYGYGGASFCLATSVILTLVYALVLFSTFIAYVRSRLDTPNKPPFYQYCAILMLIHCLQACGAGLIYINGNPNGLCLLNLASFLYVAFFAPLVFVVFLNPLFNSSQPTLMFTYKAQLDDLEDDDEDRMNSARGSLQFSLTTTQDHVQPDDSQPIVLNGGNETLIEGLASPDSVIEELPTEKY